MTPWERALELAAIAARHGLVVQLRTTDLKTAGVQVECLARTLGGVRAVLAFEDEAGVELTPAVAYGPWAWNVR